MIPDNPMTSAQPTDRSTHADSIVQLTLIAWVVIVIVRNAWLSDDAFIAFRIVHNFVEGRGMTWNPGQRVQAFTHPAWFFLVSAAYALTREMYYTALALSIFVAGAAVWLAATRLASEAWNAWPALVALSFSRAFIDFSTSGLENTLSHLLLYAGLVGLVRASSRDRLYSPWLDLNFGLLAFNRLDLTLLVAPSWLWLVWRRQRMGMPLRRLLIHVAIATLPVLTWWAFSIVYFGFALPNTAYAKLGIDLTLGERSAQGFFYLLTLIGTDPTSALLLAVGLLGVLRVREPWLRPMLLGAALYVLYVIYIGGDFMAGRFLSAPLVVATAVLLRMRVDRTLSLGLAGMFALAGWAGQAPPPCSGVTAEGRTGAKLELERYRVMDERRYYHAVTGLLTADRVRPMPGGVYRDAIELAGKRGVKVPKIGMRGFLAGPTAVLIDPYALTDPFLARLPFPRQAIQPDWTVGHFKRPQPRGYVATIQSGENRLLDPKLARFYDEMQLITTAPLWSTARLRAIWRLNTGNLKSLTRAAAQVDESDDTGPDEDDD